MKSVSFGWKLFWIFSYIQLAVTGGCLVLLFYSMGFEGILFNAFLIGFVVLIFPFLGSANNVSAMHRNYPDKPLQPGTMNYVNVISIITAVEWVILLFFYIYVFFDELERRNEPYHDDIGLYILGVLMLDWLIGAYLLIFQFKLSSVMRRNSKRSFQDMIDSIGRD